MDWLRGHRLPPAPTTTTTNMTSTIKNKNAFHFQGGPFIFTVAKSSSHPDEVVKAPRPPLHTERAEAAGMHVRGAARTQDEREEGAGGHNTTLAVLRVRVLEAYIWIIMAGQQQQRQRRPGAPEPPSPPNQQSNSQLIFGCFGEDASLPWCF